MPYSVPTTEPFLAAHAHHTRHHHRSTSPSSRFSTDKSGPGAFAPLPTPPRRRTSPTRPVFQFHNDSSSTDDDLDDPNDRDHSPPPATNLKLTSTPAAVPFPRKSSPSPRAHSPHASPILLANGKPLRPSLKSSSSSPHIPTQNSPNTSTTSPNAPLHLRSQSAPSTPSLDGHSTTHAHTPKNVHFKEDARLASVRVFNKAGRPRSVSTDTPDETETETEGYDSNGNARVEAHGHGAVRFPFPRLPPPTSAPTLTLAPPPLTSSIPAAPPHHPPPFPPHILLTSLALHTTAAPAPAPAPTPSLTLRGTLLVLNITYEKRVSVRFTLDDWLTTSEVGASYCGAGVLPVDWARCVSGDPAYDTFTFTISLSDLFLTRTLPTRVLFLCARYESPMHGGGGEWWDNNGGGNYRVGFVEGGTSGGVVYSNLGASSSPTPTTTTTPTPIPTTKPTTTPPTRPKLGTRSYSSPAAAQKYTFARCSAGAASFGALPASTSVGRGVAGMGMGMGGVLPRRRVGSGVAAATSASIPAPPNDDGNDDTDTTTTTHTHDTTTHTHDTTTHTHAHDTPLRLDVLARGTGFSHYELPYTPSSASASPAWGKEEREDGRRTHAHDRDRDRTTPPMSPYNTTKLTLRNYAPPAGVVSSTHIHTHTPSTPSTSTSTAPVSTRSTAATPAGTATGLTTVTPPTTPPPALYGSPLPTPPASRSSSDSDLAGAGAGGVGGGAGVGAGAGAGVGVGVGVVGGQYATLVDLESSGKGEGVREGARKERGGREGGGGGGAREGRDSYAALLARWCFHTSGPGGAGAGVGGDDANATPVPREQGGGDSPAHSPAHSQTHSHYFTTPGPSGRSPSSASTPRSAGSSASASASSFFTPVPASSPLTSPHALTSTPRTGSLDDMRAFYERHHGYGEHYWTRGEAYGSDPGRGSGSGVGAGYGHGHGHGVGRVARAVV